MQKWLPFIVFVIVLGASRLLGAMAPESLGNFQPFGALFFCGMACFGARWIWLPALAWFISAPLTSAMQGFGWSAQILTVVAGFAALVALGKVFHGKKAGAVFAGSILAALAFYLVTNTISWMIDPGYAKSLGGLGQALTTGLPGYVPTWTFLKNSLISQVVFTGAFLMAYGYFKLPESEARRTVKA